jgi:hypothetical protein
MDIVWLPLIDWTKGDRRAIRFDRDGFLGTLADTRPPLGIRHPDDFRVTHTACDDMTCRLASSRHRDSSSNGDGLRCLNQKSDEIAV